MIWLPDLFGMDIPGTLNGQRFKDLSGAKARSSARVIRSGLDGRLDLARMYCIAED